MSEQRKCFCVYCGSQMEEGYRFCVNCGKPVYDGAESSKKANVLLSILFSVVSILGFYLLDGIIAIALGFAIYFLVEVPLVGVLMEWLLSIGGNTADSFVITISLICSYVFISMFISRLGKNEKTQKLAQSIMGVGLIILNVIFLISNLSTNDAVLSNILMIITGITLFVKGKQSE